MLQLIEKLPAVKLPTGKWRSQALFSCSYCEKCVVREPHHGKRMKSCGCAWLAGRTKHGGTTGYTRSKTYKCWEGMRRRCYNPRDVSYRLYGGRGITVCDEWRESFVAFRDWALPLGGEERGLSIDRINTDGNYEPKNCRFVTPQQNTHNRRCTKLDRVVANCVRVLSASGVRDCDIARFSGANLDTSTIYKIRLGQIWMEAA